MNDIKSGLETLKKVYHLLDDDESQEIYANRLAYYITDQRTYLENFVNTYVRKLLGQFAFSDQGISQLVKSLPPERSVVLFGAGRDGAKLLRTFRNDSRFIGFCSSTKEKQQNGYMGFPVMSPSELLSRRDLSVVISTIKGRSEVLEILRSGGYPESLIFLRPDSYYLKTGVEEQYFGPEFMRYETREVFIDAGCFDFGSSLALAKHCASVKSYAFEPDPENYQRCQKAIEERNHKCLPEVRLFPYGTWSEKTTLHFVATGTGSAHTAMDGITGTEISAISIDEAVDPGDRITMIKMDVEGAELESLKGAKQTIMRDKPKLAICIYHKPEDLWEIPLYIKALVPEYRLYIRHHGISDCETVLYAVMPT